MPALADRSSLDLPPVPAEWRGPGRTWLVFATRYCATCGPLADSLRRAHPEDDVRIVSVEEHTDLADRYHVRTAPTLLEVASDGHIVHSLAGIDDAVDFQRTLTA